MAARAASLVTKLQNLLERLNQLADDDLEGLYALLEEAWAVMDATEQQVHPSQLSKYNLRVLPLNVAVTIFDKFLQAVDSTAG
jgi:hypothetical protein